MAKAVILKTHKGIMLIGSWQCCNGAYWDAEGCFNYCNDTTSEYNKKHQSVKLYTNATLLGPNPKATEDWYKYRENFIDIEVPYDDVDQTYEHGVY